MNIQIIILAAGSSTRLGQAKQLLPYKGSTLLQHTIDVCIDSGLGGVHLVLGCDAEQVRESIVSDQLNVLVNPHYQKGLGTSIAYGMKNIDVSETDAVILVLADQVYLNKEILNELVLKKRSTDASIIICNYNEGNGPPSLFDRSLFDELSRLDGDDGAKEIVKKYKDQVAFVSFPKGDIDVDVPEHLSRLEF